MKTKFLSYILLALLMFYTATLTSCSKDDDIQPKPPIPVESRYLSKVTDEDGETVVSIEYDENKRIKKYSLDIASYSYRYEYGENNRVNKVFLNAGAAYEITYTYNESGIISSFSVDDGVSLNYPVIYDEAANSYAFSGLFGASYKVFLDQNNHCNKIIINPDDPESITTLYLFYEQNQRGSLYNGSNMDLTNYIGPYPMFYVQSSINTSDLPIEEISFNNGSITFDNEFDADLFLTKTTKNQTIPDTENGGVITIVDKLTYHYIEL